MKVRWNKKKTSLDRIQKSLRYGPSNLDTTLSQNVYNTRSNRTVYREDHANLESGIDSRRTKLSRGKDPKRHIPEGCTTAITLCAMMLLNHILRKCTAGYKFSKSQENINHLIYMDIKLFTKKRKRIGNPNTNCENTFKI